MNRIQDTLLFIKGVTSQRYERLYPCSKASSEATAPQTSPKKIPGTQFHHHVVPTEKSGALNVYVLVSYGEQKISCLCFSMYLFTMIIIVANMI